VGFQRRDFGNQQAKSEALQRMFGFDDDSVGTAVQRARRLSGLDKVLGASILRPAGLGNWDNSCYQNSIIQSLASLPLFDKYLAHNVENMSSNDARSTHDALRNIIGRLNHSDNEGRRLWTPSVLKSMNSWQQQDAQEYFSRIIDEVDREIAKFAKHQTTELGFRHAADNDKMPMMWQQNPCQGLLAQRVGCTRCGYTEGLSLLPFTCLTVNLGPHWEHNIQDCLDDYTALESIEGVECTKCTILRTKASLEQVLLNVDVNRASKPGATADSTSMSTLRNTVTERLKVINEVCDAGDFSDSGLYKKCNISAKSRVSSTKSKQAIVARAPHDLVIHVNRSIFDASGMQRKNHARVHFPIHLDIGKWCLGSDSVPAGQEVLENWNTSPTDSMLPKSGAGQLGISKSYRLQAVITHYGGHENGHYIAYRRRTSNRQGLETLTTDAKKSEESWYRFSDDVVSPVSEDHVLSQGGVFMLFYEATSETGKQSHAPAPKVADGSTTSHREASLAVSTAKTEATEVEDAIAEAVDNEPESAQPDPSIIPSSKVDSPTTSPVVIEPCLPLIELDAKSNPIVQPEPARVQSVAPLMRTAGALSPNSGEGRRSSNISIHSPSFITAS
jgi:ubiquitin carboxyl-terminal hydrolase 1